MPASSEIVAERIFEILKGFNLTLSIFDGDGNRTVDPKESRKFFAKPNKMLVSFKEDGENSEINCYLSASIDIKKIEKLVESLRNLAVHFNMQFNIKKYGVEITPKDFAWVGESRGNKMDKVEEARNPMTGSMKSSYQNWNSAKLIVRHTKPVAEEINGARSRNIQKIFVETIEGERFKFPVNHLAGARAMARHIGAGGTFYDKVGQHIIGLSEEFKDMQKVSSYIYRGRQALGEDAFNLRESIRTKINELRHELGRFLTISGYSQKVEEIETTEAEPLNEDSLKENIAIVRSMLQLDEDDTSLDVALTRIAPMVTEKEPEIDVDPQLVELVRKAYGEGEAKDSEFIDAARLLANPNLIEFSPPNEKAQIKKNEFGGKISTLGKLSWRLGAISERMLPKSAGVFILSAILSRIAAKIEQVMDTQGPTAKVSVNSAQRQIIQLFLREIAPVIGESMQVAGYSDWELREENSAPDTDVDNVIIHNESKKKGVSYKEAREISEWFENFDPLKIIRESAKKEAEVEEGKEDEIEEQHEEITESSVLNKDEAWWIADFLVRGKAIPSDIVTCYEADDRVVIAEVLKENWTTKTTEEIIKNLEILETDNEVDETCKSHRVKKKSKVTEYGHAKDENLFIWFADEKSLEKAKLILDKNGDVYIEHNNELDHGLEFKGPRVKSAYEVLFAKNPEIEIRANPNLSGYVPSRKVPKNRVNDHPDFDPTHRDAIRNKQSKLRSNISNFTIFGTPVRSSIFDDSNNKDDRVLGGDVSKAFKQSVQSAKERVKKNQSPFKKTNRAKKIERSKDELKSRDYQK